MVKDDYFARNGRFLFRDNKSTDNVMIITPDHNYKKRNVESILTGTESNITETYLSNGAIKSIVSHYNAQLDQTDGEAVKVNVETVYYENPLIIMGYGAKIGAFEFLTYRINQIDLSYIF